MKSCAYCGKENEDAATVCGDCGNAEFRIATTPPVVRTDTAITESESHLGDIIDDPPRMFRVLVVVATGTYLIWFIHLVFGGRLISPGVWDALAWQGYGAILPIPARVGWLFMLVSVAVAVGLYGFSKSARLVFTLFVAFGLFTTLLSGVQVQTALDSLLCLITNMADGAILVMAYTSPLKDRFA